MTMTSVAMMAFMATAAQAGQPQYKVTAYLLNRTGSHPENWVLAEGLAGKMFAEIGISLEWRTGKPGGDRAQAPVFIELATNTPEDLNPGALAYALPYEGAHIRVYYDRIAACAAPATLLAHVMVHEITHLLQGLSHHAEEGMMKAHWSGKDLCNMRYRPLAFTVDDIAMINAGMAARTARAVALVAAR